MGFYRCCECEGYFDSHEHGCREHPTEEFELVCEDCGLNLIGDEGE